MYVRQNEFKSYMDVFSQKINKDKEFKRTYNLPEQY